MVGATPQQQQQQQPPTPTAATTVVVMTPEEEFLKRNTDCVYFLASPLTCKKGSECEYRHSDIARVNPRDCWYWLNGNCLNPKCAFRHPPLDGLLGAELPTPIVPSVPQVQTPAIPAAHSSYVTGKQGVPCIFFQKGYCLKGDRCPFLHPPTSGSSKVAQSATAAPVTEPPTLKKTFGGLEKCTQEQKVLQTNVPKAVELPPQGKPSARIEVAAARNGVVVDKNVPPPSVLGDDLPRYRPRSVPPVNEISSISRSNRVYQAHISDNDSVLNGKDADEFSREPSPGFDVLVDDELRDSDYYHGEEQFGRNRGPDGRNMNPMNDYDLGRSSDYNSMADVERNMYRDPRDYDSYERLQGGHFGWEEQRGSSERMLGGSSHVERRRYPRDESPEELKDLRHRISKQRRGNGLRSVVSRERTHDSHAEDRNYRGGPRRENHMALHEGSLSSRLRGRIKVPGRSTSPVNENDIHAERDMDVGRHRARLSPGRPHIASSQGRLRDRIKGRVQEDLNDEGRDFRGRIRRDIITDNNSEFSGPKRLSELKSGKTTEGHELQINDRQSLGKRKYPKVESRQQSEDCLSFEGPKPLSEILKRKRGAESQVSERGGYNNEDNNEKDGKGSLIKSTVYDSNKEESNSASVETEKQVQEEKAKATGGRRSSMKHDVNEEEIEEGIIGDDAIDDHDLENFDHREGDFDYEQVDGEDYNLEEGENGEAEEEEYLDEDDGDDFAKKMGVMFS